MSPIAWRTGIVSIIFRLSCWSLYGQQVTPIGHNPITANGVVEAVIGNGDLKPARFAQVLAVPTQVAGDLKVAVAKMSELIDNARGKAPEGPQLEAVELQCVIGLMKIKLSILPIEQAAKDNPGNGVVFADADELGEFTLNGLGKQPYTIFATGKIGMNAALWLVDYDPTGQQTRIKMVRPQLGCYDANGFYKP